MFELHLQIWHTSFTNLITDTAGGCTHRSERKWEKERERERKQRTMINLFGSSWAMQTHICPCIFTQESLAHMHLNLTSSIFMSLGIHSGNLDLWKVELLVFLTTKESKCLRQPPDPPDQNPDTSLRKASELVHSSWKNDTFRFRWKHARIKWGWPRSFKCF